MTDRAFGWVQNPSNLESLQKVVQIFDSASAQYTRLRDVLVSRYVQIASIRASLQDLLNQGVTTFSYRDLVGRSQGADGRAPARRADAVADALIQVTIPSQSAATRQKYWTDNWTADGYLRWAVSLNFVAYIREEDSYAITPLGLEFSRANSEESFHEIMTTAFLSYPPATRILSLLEASGQSLNKFELGHQLGFTGEPGFTSYSSDIMIEYLQQAESISEASKIRADVEGTSDKYARMISGWLIKVGLVKSKSVIIETARLGDIVGFREYKITAMGVHKLRQSQGSSINSRVDKFVMWEFFATTGTDRAYVRTRRATILQDLMATPRKSKTALMNELRTQGIDDDWAIIENDIDGFNSVGIRIESLGNQLILRDRVLPFEIPENYGHRREQNDIEETAEKAEFLNRTHLPARFIELLSIAYQPRRNRDFEIITAELFRDVYGLDSLHLGNARKPDALVFTDNFGVIVDTKAYANGYSKSIGQEDEMVRYIEDNQQRSRERNANEWWLGFSPEIPEANFHFLWISSFFTGQFDDQLQETSQRTGVTGGALSVRQLLIGASLVQEQQLNSEDLPAYMTNRQIIFEN